VTLDPDRYVELGESVANGDRIVYVVQWDSES
jgi:hypothetical protein